MPILRGPGLNQALITQPPSPTGRHYPYFAGQLTKRLLDVRSSHLTVQEPQDPLYVGQGYLSLDSMLGPCTISIFGNQKVGQTASHIKTRASIGHLCAAAFTKDGGQVSQASSMNAGYSAMAVDESSMRHSPIPSSRSAEPTVENEFKAHELEHVAIKRHHHTPEKTSKRHEGLRHVDSSEEIPLAIIRTAGEMVAQNQ